MRLQSKIVVDYTLDQVTQFFYEPSSLAKWDRSVAEMVPLTPGDEGRGSTFYTIAPSGMRMDYEVIEFDSPGSIKVKLLNSKIFKTGIWHFQFEPVGEKTEITCNVFFKTYWQYAFLYPVMFFSKSALIRDLNFFKEALDENVGRANG